MKTSARSSFLFLVISVVLVFAVALNYHKNFSVLVFAGEESVATWVSGVLLIFSAALCMVLSMTQRAYPWMLLCGFFLLLALDERFMFHERIKDWIIFSSPNKPSRWIYELPVFAGALLGAMAAYVIWKYSSGIARTLVVAAACIGLVSVVIDVFTLGVLYEECSKLAAELLMTAALLETTAKIQSGTA